MMIHALIHHLKLSTQNSPAASHHARAKQYLHANRAWPDKGAIDLPSLPGLGIQIDDARVDSGQELS